MLAKMADDRRKRGGRGRSKQVAASSGKRRGVKPTAPAPATATQGRDGTGSQSESDSSEDGVDLQASQQTGDGPAASADEEGPGESPQISRFLPEWMFIESESILRKSG